MDPHWVVTTADQADPHRRSTVQNDEKNVEESDAVYMRWGDSSLQHTTPPVNFGRRKGGGRVVKNIQTNGYAPYAFSSTVSRGVYDSLVPPGCPDLLETKPVLQENASFFLAAHDAILSMLPCEQIEEVSNSPPGASCMTSESDVPAAAPAEPSIAVTDSDTDWCGISDCDRIPLTENLPVAADASLVERDHLGPGRKRSSEV
jgi:hypothetical protein